MSHPDDPHRKAALHISFSLCPCAGTRTPAIAGRDWRVLESFKRFIHIQEKQEQGKDRDYERHGRGGLGVGYEYSSSESS
jgi:hypothetical protein